MSRLVKCVSKSRWCKIDISFSSCLFRPCSYGGQGHHYILYYTDILHEKSSLIAPRYGALCKKDIIVIIYVQESRKEKALGLVKFFPALAYNFCLTFACRIVTTWGPLFLATPVSHAINMKVTRIWNNDPNTALCITNLHGECDILLTFTPSLRDKPYSWINNNS